MSNFNLGFQLPFSFETKADGTIHETDNNGFPHKPNRSIWHEDYPQIAYAPDAFAFAVDMEWESTGKPQTAKDILKSLQRNGFGKFSRGSATGNLSKAYKQGLIGKMTVKSYNAGRRNKVTSENLYVPKDVEKVLNGLTENIARWIDSPNEVTNMDLLKYLEDFCRTAKAQGLNKLKGRPAFVFDVDAEGLPF
tara:strand:- start:3994 stop:4572 length:579 start_codon:yes stop_codon:yes gene_type:complete